MVIVPITLEPFNTFGEVDLSLSTGEDADTVTPFDSIANHVRTNEPGTT